MPFYEPYFKTPSDRRILTACGLQISLLTLTFTVAGAKLALELGNRGLDQESGELCSWESHLTLRAAMALNAQGISEL